MPSYDTRSGGNFRGFTPSVKNACSTPWYSLAEEATTLLLEFSQEVLRFRSAQDRTFVLREASQVCRYTPDYEVVRRDGSTVFVEAKPAKDLQKPSVQARMARARAVLAQHGYALFIWDERTYSGTKLLTIYSFKQYRSNGRQKYGISIRLDINYTSSGGAISLANLFGFLSANGNASKFDGQLSLSAHGLVNSKIAALLPVPAKLDDSAAAQYFGYMGALKGLITDQGTTIDPVQLSQCY
ncbi:TPA: hypothetical protein QDB44_003411 [Burkholderia vietnamiensis]|nr:hypothetical protein [Burkholderia vietnamiensis]